jgi:hypothetical protein
MNALETLNEIAVYMESQDHWLKGRLADNSRVLASIADRVIQAAEELKRLKQERIEQLARDGPSVQRAICGEITVTLLRDGKETFYQAGDYYLETKWTSKDEVREHFKLTGPPDADGRTYILEFEPLGLGPRQFAIQLSRDEAASIQKQLDQIYKDPYDE